MSSSWQFLCLPYREQSRPYNIRPVNPFPRLTVILPHVDTLGGMPAPFSMRTPFSTWAALSRKAQCPQAGMTLVGWEGGENALSSPSGPCVPPKITDLLFEAGASSHTAAPPGKGRFCPVLERRGRLSPSWGKGRLPCSLTEGRPRTEWSPGTARPS